MKLKYIQYIFLFYLAFKVYGQLTTTDPCYHFDHYDHKTSYLNGEYILHWSLKGDYLHVGIRGETDTAGWVGFSISGEIHQMIGSEAVIGFYNGTESVHSYFLERKNVDFIINIDDSIPLSNTSACIESYKGKQYTNVHFVRNVKDGNNTINVGKNEPTNICVAIGPEPRLSYHLTRRSLETIVLNPKPEKPVAPKPHEPIAPKPQKPVAPKPQEPIAPKPQKPVAPKPQEPIAPKPQKPVAPKPHHPLEPIAPSPNKPKIPEKSPVEKPHFGEPSHNPKLTYTKTLIFLIFVGLWI